MNKIENAKDNLRKQRTISDTIDLGATVVMLKAFAISCFNTPFDDPPVVE